MTAVSQVWPIQAILPKARTMFTPHSIIPGSTVADNPQQQIARAEQDSFYRQDVLFLAPGASLLEQQVFSKNPFSAESNSRPSFSISAHFFLNVGVFTSVARRFRSASPPAPGLRQECEAFRVERPL